MTDLDDLEKKALAVKGWQLSDAWLDTSEDDTAAVVGAIDEEGNEYPVAVIDCDQYFQGQDSLPLAKFYAAANPSAILDLIARCRKAEARVAELEAQRGEAVGVVTEMSIAGTPRQIDWQGNVSLGDKLYLRAPQVPEGWKLLGEMRENGVVWFDQNPHAFPVGTQFYAALARSEGEVTCHN